MRSEKLPKSEILRKKDEISQLFAHGKFYRGRAFDIVYRKSKRRKVLFAVSSRVRTHVAKNRIKRRLREVYRRSKYLLPADIHIAIIGKPSTINTSFSTLQEEFKSMIDKW